LPAANLIAFGVGKTFPNPVRRTATIPFSLPREADVTMTVHDVSGRVVAIVSRAARFTAGVHTLPLAAGDLASGVYYLRMIALGEERVSRIVVVR
jgi:hypothetical protein